MGWVRTLGVIVAVAGCGPAVSIGSDDESTTTAAGDDGSTTSPTTFVTTSADDGASATTTSSSSTSTSTETTSAETVDASSEDVTFIMDPTECFTHCTKITCDLWVQDCPEGEKCMPWANDGSSQWTSARCSPVSDLPGAPGDACLVEGSGWSGIDDCQLSSMCWDVDPETNVGTCVPFCGGSEANPVCEGDAACFAAYDGSINLCLPGCDPLAPACAPGFACVESHAQVHPVRFACVPEELVADRSAYADTCDGMIGCGTGLLCRSADGVPACKDESCCTTLCDPLAANACPDAASGQVCILDGGSPTVGHCAFG